MGPAVTRANSENSNFETVIFWLFGIIFDRFVENKQQTNYLFNLSSLTIKVTVIAES